MGTFPRVARVGASAVVVLAVRPAARAISFQHADDRPHGLADFSFIFAAHQFFPDVNEEIFSGLFQLGGVMLMTFFPSLPIFGLVVPFGLCSLVSARSFDSLSVRVRRGM